MAEDELRLPDRPAWAPGPVPTFIQWGHLVAGDGSAVVTLTVHDPTGQHVTFMSPDVARQTGAQAINEASIAVEAARQALIAPSPADILEVKRSRNGERS